MYLQSTLITAVLLVFVATTDGSLDLSNLDWKNFNFFRYPQLAQDGEVVYRRYQPFNIFDPIDHFNRAKAMLKYFREVALGNPKYQREIAVYFHPETASRLRPHFQQKFGYRGEKLIAALGKGLVNSL